jgi:dTDP-4-dehydrorhamnose 3,5-epimerase-like enzyme
MSLVRHIEVYPLASIKGGMAQFYTPQSSHETMLVQIPANTIDDLFVHHFQTDQLLVVRGSFVLVVLQNRAYQYIHLSEDKPQVVRIPPGIPHGAINLSDRDCVLVNAVLRHGPAYEKDYRPLKRPFPYDLAQVQAQPHAIL